MKLLNLALVALFALAGVASVLPAASAQPCNAAATCCAVSMCTCTLCDLGQILSTTSCGPVLNSVTTVAALEGTPLCGLNVGVCTAPRFASIDPHGPGRLYCGGYTFVALP